MAQVERPQLEGSYTVLPDYHFQVAKWHRAQKKRRALFLWSFGLGSLLEGLLSAAGWYWGIWLFTVPVQALIALRVFHLAWLEWE